MDTKQLENWLQEAACRIHDEVDTPKYKDFILSSIFIKRLSDVFEDEVEELTKEYGSKETVTKPLLLEQDHSLVRFYIPKEARWKEIAKQATNLGECLTNCVRKIAKHNPKLQGVIIVINKAKSQIETRKLKIILINLSHLYEKGRSKNYLQDETIQKAYEIYKDFKEEEGISKVIAVGGAQRNDYNLGPSRYLPQTTKKRREKNQK